MTNTLLPQELDELKRLKRETDSKEGLRLESLKGFEKSGFGHFIKRWAFGKSSAAFTALGRFEVALATLVGEKSRPANAINFQDIVSGLKQIPANANHAHIDHSHLTKTFDNALTTETLVSLDTFQKLKEHELTFEQALLEKSRTTVPILSKDHSVIQEIFQAQQTDMHKIAKNHDLRVLFDRETGAVHYAHDQTRVDQIMGSIQSKSPHKNNASIRVITFTASANASHSPQQTSSNATEKQVPEPHLRMAS